MRHFRYRLKLICKSFYIAQLWLKCSSASCRTFFLLGKRGEKKEIADMLRRKVCVLVIDFCVCKGFLGIWFGAVGLIANFLEDCLGVSDCHNQGLGHPFVLRCMGRVYSHAGCLLMVHTSQGCGNGLGKFGAVVVMGDTVSELILNILQTGNLL